MIKSIVMHDIPINDIAAMERWYYKDHAPEIVRRFGPWLPRHESYLPVMAPADAQSYGFFNWRVTEGWWRKLPKTGPSGTFSFTIPPVWPKVATCFVPAQPTEDFMGSEHQPYEKNVLRWFIMLKYPAGVTREEGDEWFLNVHAKEVMKQPGLYRFFSYRTIKEPIHLPGTWPPDSYKDMANKVIGSEHWDRVVELWYETFDDWRKSVLLEPPLYTKPKWANYERYPFLKPGVDIVSSFLLERPVDEFGRDARGYL